MATIEVDDGTSARLVFAARIAGTSVAEVVRGLVEDLLTYGEAIPGDAVGPDDGGPYSDEPGRFEGASLGMTVSQPVPRPPLAIYCDYLGAHVETEYSFLDGSVKMRDGQLAGQTYTSLTRAAEAVVTWVNPGREHAQTNGRLFWRVTATGAPIRSILGQR